MGDIVDFIFGLRLEVEEELLDLEVEEDRQRSPSNWYIQNI